MQVGQGEEIWKLGCNVLSEVELSVVLCSERLEMLLSVFDVVEC